MGVSISDDEVEGRDAMWKARVGSGGSGPTPFYDLPFDFSSNYPSFFNSRIERLAALRAILVITSYSDSFRGMR